VPLQYIPTFNITICLSSPIIRADYVFNTSRCALLQHFASKIYNKKTKSTEAPRHKILKFKILKIQKLFGPLLGSRWLLPLFQYSLVACDLTTSDVSTTFPASFFTVMPKGLTTGPKSMCDYGCLITYYPFTPILIIWCH